jgi:hypothetical protein
MMRRADVVLGAVVTAVGAAALVLSLKMRFYADHIPGPGFFPTLLTSGLVILGLLLVRQGLKPEAPEVRAIGAVSDVEKNRHGKADTDEAAGPFLPKRSVAVMAGYVAAVPLLAFIGFVLTTMLLMAYLLFFVERRRGFGPISAVIVVPIAVYLLFVQLLGIELPVGIIGLGVLGI